MAPTKNPHVRLLHIRDEIDGVNEALQHLSFDEYRNSYIIRRATERAIQIVSEAAGALPANLRASYPGAPWAAIIGIGNILRHEYQHVDDKRLWDVATVGFPELRDVVVTMLKALGHED